MRVLITGSQGFLARNLSKKLSKNKVSCYGIGRGKWKKKEHYKKWGYYQNINGNINQKSLQKFKKIKFNYIIHCAGGISPIASLIKSISINEDFEKNVLSTHSILDYTASTNKKTKIIFMSTVSVYGNSKSKKLRENYEINPTSNYARNKFIAENLCNFYNKKFKIDILILRGSSIFGPGLKRQLIHDVCQKILKQKNTFFGTGEEVRDFIYIDDICELIKAIIKKSFKGYNVINAGTGKGTKIKKIINYINNKLSGKIKPKFNKIGSDTNPLRLIPDIEKAKKFNWRPKIKLYDGLNTYLEWFLKNKKND